jgi:hypothetical protein
MDMVLYSLIMNQLKKQDICSTWNGFRIVIVDELPEVQAPNTIYLIKTDFTVDEIKR